MGQSTLLQRRKVSSGVCMGRLRPCCLAFRGIDCTMTKREEMIQQKMSISTITRKRHGLASMRHIEEAIHHSDDGNGGERGCDGGGGARGEGGVG